MGNRRRVDAKGRNSSWKGVALDDYVLSCPAYRALNGDARALYIEFRRRFAPSRNGAIPYSVREMARDVNRTEKTVRNALADLIEKGFVRCLQKGAFSMKIRHASEWELTEYGVGEKPASKDFMRWRPDAEKTRRQVFPPMEGNIPTVD